MTASDTATSRGKTRLAAIGIDAGHTLEILPLHGLATMYLGTRRTVRTVIDV